MREMIKNSPDPWKVLKTLRPETRAKLIDFVDNGELKICFKLSWEIRIDVTLIGDNIHNI